MGIPSVLWLPVNKVRQALPEGAGQTVAKIGIVASLALLLVGTGAPFLLPHGSMGFYLSISLGLADFVVFVGLIVYLSHQKLPADAKTSEEYEPRVDQMTGSSKTIHGYLEEYNETNLGVDLIDQFNTDAPTINNFRVDGEVVGLDEYPMEEKVRRVSCISVAANVTGILESQYVNANLNCSFSRDKYCVNAIKDGNSVSTVQLFTTFKIKEGENIIGYVQTRTDVDLRSENAELTWSKPLKVCPDTAYFKDKKSH